MNEKRFKSILEQLGQQAFPDDIDPWAPIQQQLDKETISLKTRKRFTFTSYPKTRTNQVLAGISIALFLIVAIVMALPDKRAFAEMLQHFFNPVTSDQIATPVDGQLTTPTYASTFAVTLAAIEEIAATDTHYPIPTESPTPALGACNPNDPYSYACRILKAEKRAGFDAKEFPKEPDGYVFSFVSAEPGSIQLEYNLIGGGGYLYLSQGLGDEFPPSTGQVPEEAIEVVQIGKYRGEFVMGIYVYMGDPPTATWISGARTRLRWVEDGHWFEIVAEGGPIIEREQLIQLAQQLVAEPVPTNAPNPNYLTSLNEIDQLAEFSILSPEIIPSGFRFDYGSYDDDLSQVQIFYTPPGNEYLGAAHLWIVETPLEKVYLAPDENGESIVGEEVDINGYSGIYISHTPYSHTVTWETEELKITLSVYSSEIWYGGSYTKEQVLEIARSIQ